MRVKFVALLLLVAAVDAAGQSVLTRVKPGDPALADLIARGRTRSPSFKALTDALETSGWTIFVQPGHCPDRVLVGCLVHMVGKFEGRPYLRLLVAPAGRHPDVVIATIAHELQHAYEVVSDGGVIDTGTLQEFTRRIASDRWRTSKATIYETSAAQRMGEPVLKELGRQRERTE